MQTFESYPVTTVTTKVGLGNLIFEILNNFKKHVLITGPSGIGKTLIIKLLKEQGFRAYDLDQFGAVTNGHWQIDFTKVPKGWQILGGMAYNLGDLTTIVKMTDVAIVYIIRLPDAWRTTLSERVNEPNYGERFRKWSQYSDKKVLNAYEETFRRWKHLFIPANVYVINNALINIGTSVKEGRA